MTRAGAALVRTITSNNIKDIFEHYIMTKLLKNIQFLKIIKGLNFTSCNLKCIKKNKAISKRFCLKNRTQLTFLSEIIMLSILWGQ